MSKDANGLFLDTGLLRDHVSKLRKDKRTAIRLYESILAMKNASDPTVSEQYGYLLYKAEQLVEYFERMIRVLSETEGEAVRLSDRIAGIIKDDTRQLHLKASQSFML